MINKHLIVSKQILVSVLLSWSASSVQGERPEPGVPRMNQTEFETQDHVITTHDVRELVQEHGT